ncbi:hypothetical protein NHL50_10185 [Acidimicrobiia bacterium EGI L10123]|uniref:hypothetical protein n=1 Tax=Salinilacustrithrix flava TaxID=2957203 RepID=UPI003D7C288B|nr:hypothetical protein [Acidimicrobiia bacterium EGI L10123]
MNRRLPVLVLLIAFVVAGVVLDREATDDTSVEAVTVVPSEFPMAPSSTALASTWFCAGGTADEEAFADHVITMLNTTDGALDVDVTAFPGVVAAPAPGGEADELAPDADADPDDEEADEEVDEEPATDPASVSAEPVVRRIEIGPRSRARLALTDLVTAPVASALVESVGGGLVVEHEVSSIHGIDAKPCATGASDEWHFAWGTTAREARELLVLFNPFPDDAIVEGVFSTEDTIREPGRFAGGLVVPGRSTIGIDLGDDVTRRDEVAASLTTRTGRIIVDRIVRVNEDGGDRGLTVQLGVTEPQRTWIFPDGIASEEFQERFVVYNPTEELAEVEIDLRVDRPEENGVPAPVELSIAPGSHATVDMNEDGRLPVGVPHSAVVRSANDVPVVAERVLSSLRTSGRRGLSVTTGSPVEATEWTFAAGSTEEPSAESITIVNLDPQVLTEVDVVAIVGGQEVPVADLQGVVVEAGERLNVDLTPQIANRDDLAVVVRATEPVVVERILAQLGEEQRGISLAVGVPSPDGARVPADPVDLGVEADLGDELEEAPTEDDEGIPVAPDDVELPAPDETIVVDPDDESEVPADDAEDGEG